MNKVFLIQKAVSIQKRAYLLDVMSFSFLNKLWFLFCMKYFWCCKWSIDTPHTNVFQMP